MSKNVQIYDTTLRDGMQGMEITYTLNDKLQITEMLDSVGIDYIEGGFPLSSEKEAAFFAEVGKLNLRHAKIAAFGSTRRPGGMAAKDPHINALLNAETSAVVVVGKSWLEHVTKVLKTDGEENLKMIFDSINYLKQQEREVIFDLEHFFDGYKADPEYAQRVLRTGTEAGAHSLVLCDTNGGVLPGEIAAIIDTLPQNDLAPLGIHLHNDSGTAVAGSLLSLDHGVTHIQGTINGWGERCGNANLCTVIPNICLKTEYSAKVCERIDQLTLLSRFVAEKANIIPDKRQPYVGEAAFSHKAGQHADVIQKASHLMEHIDGAVVGNTRRILLSELAGKSTIVKKIAKYGDFEKSSPIVSTLVDCLKQKEIEGYEYEAAEASFDLLVRRALDIYTPLLELKNYHLESFKTRQTPSKTVGRLFLSSEGKEIMGAAVGIGPVETLDHALRDALLPHHPFLNDINLIDYRVRVLNPQYAASAKVRVFITTSDHVRTWDTVGVSENIVEASWEALLDSLEYYYNNYILTGANGSENK